MLSGHLNKLFHYSMELCHWWTRLFEYCFVLEWSVQWLRSIRLFSSMWNQSLSSHSQIHYLEDRLLNLLEKVRIEMDRNHLDIDRRFVHFVEMVTVFHLHWDNQTLGDNWEYRSNDVGHAESLRKVVDWLIIYVFKRKQKHFTCDKIKKDDIRRIIPPMQHCPRMFNLFNTKKKKKRNW